MIPCLLGKALRMRVDIARLAEQFNMPFSKSSLVNLITKDASDVSDVIQKVQRHPDLIKAHAVR